LLTARFSLQSFKTTSEEKESKLFFDKTFLREKVGLQFRKNMKYLLLFINFFNATLGIFLWDVEFFHFFPLFYRFFFVTFLISKFST